MTTGEWLVYMIVCDDETLYTGITNNLARRFEQHLQYKGAKYFRSRQPLRIVYLEYCADRSSASKREAAIKKLNRSNKKKLIYSQTNTVNDFFNQKNS